MAEKLLNWKDKYVIPLNEKAIDPSKPKHNSVYRCLVCGCKEGDIFTINGQGGGIPRLWGFLDSSGNVISKSRASLKGDGLVIIAPKDAVRLVINDKNKNGDCYKGMYFDSESIYAGKKLSILGDSISTYKGFVPEGNSSLYPHRDVNDVNKTWWMKLMKALGMTLEVNNSFGATRVSTSKHNSNDKNAACQPSRCENLGDSPDVIIVWMGTNDYNYNAPIGTYDGRSELPTDTSTFREAYAVMLSKILSKYKEAEVWVCTLPHTGKENDGIFPETNKEGTTITDYNNAILEIADAFGVKVLRHDKAGITYFNRDMYSMTGSKYDVHMNEKGFDLIANNDIRQMDPSVRIKY